MQRVYILTFVDGLDSQSRVFLQEPKPSDILLAIKRMFIDDPDFMITVEEIKYLLGNFNVVLEYNNKDLLFTLQSVMTEYQ